MMSFGLLYALAPPARQLDHAARQAICTTAQEAKTLNQIIAHISEWSACLFLAQHPPAFLRRLLRHTSPTHQRSCYWRC